MDGLIKANEKFLKAVYELVVNPGPIHERLKYAGGSIIFLDEESCGDFCGRIVEVKSQLSRYGSVPNTVSRLTEDEAKEIAAEILSLDRAIQSVIAQGK